MTRHRSTPNALVRLALLCVVCFSVSGCTKIASDIISIPVKVAERVAVETAKLPFAAAELGARSIVEATLGNVERALRGK